MKSLLIQIGHSRDGGRYYLTPARARNLEVVLIETPAGRDAISWGDAIGEPAFDRVVMTKDTDPITICNAVVEAAADKSVSAVLPGFELFTLTAWDAARAIKIPRRNDREVVERLRHKALQRRWLARNAPELAQPRFAVCTTRDEVTQAASRFGYPAVVKPDDSGGSMGVRLVQDWIESRAAAENLLGGLRLDDGRRSRGVVLVEEFIDGPEIGVQGVVDETGQAILMSASIKTLDTWGGQFMERRHLSMPASEIPSQVRSFVTQVVSALVLRNSPFHMDLRLRHGGAPVLIETGARLSGAYVPRALRLGGCDWAEAALSVTLGEMVDRHVPLGKWVTTDLLTSDTGGVLRMSHGPAPGLATELLLDLRRVGQEGHYGRIVDRVGVELVAFSPTEIDTLESLSPHPHGARSRSFPASDRNQGNRVDGPFIDAPMRTAEPQSCRPSPIVGAKPQVVRAQM